MVSPSFRSLSPKQLKMLSFIRQQMSRSGRPPTYRDIAAHCSITVGTVQDHIEALIKKGFLEREAGLARGLRLVHRAESMDIPILGSVPAGRPIEAIEDNLGALPVPANLRGEIYALRVKGESMRDAGILDGDFVIIKKQSTAENGDIVVAMIDGEVTVKYLEKKAGTLRLLPANPDFSPIEIHHADENFIQGKVVSVQRFL